MKLAEEAIEIYEKLLESKGEEGFYRSIIGAGMIRATKIPQPEMEILEMSEAFFALNRRTGEERYFTIGKILRRAAHKIYRELRRMDSTRQINNKFLRMVK